MENILYVYSKCSTCKKAEKFLKENKFDYLKKEIVEEIPSKDDIKKWMKKGKLDLKKFFNTSGMSYRKLELAKNYDKYTEDELLDMLSKDGMLIKRPILITKENVILGFNEKKYLDEIAKTNNN